MTLANFESFVLVSCNDVNSTLRVSECFFIKQVKLKHQLGLCSGTFTKITASQNWTEFLRITRNISYQGSILVRSFTMHWSFIIGILTVLTLYTFLMQWWYKKCWKNIEQISGKYLCLSRTMLYIGPWPLQWFLAQYFKSGTSISHPVSSTSLPNRLRSFVYPSG